jgi:hypothetical protein
MLINKFILHIITAISNNGNNAFAGKIIADKAGCFFAKICVFQIQQENGCTKCNEGTSNPQVDLLSWKNWISSSLIPHF